MGATRRPLRPMELLGPLALYRRWMCGIAWLTKVAFFVQLRDFPIKRPRRLTESLGPCARYRLSLKQTHALLAWPVTAVFFAHLWGNLLTLPLPPMELLGP